MKMLFTMSEAEVDEVVLPVFSKRSISFLFQHGGGGGGGVGRGGGGRGGVPRIADALCAPLLWLKADPGTRRIGRQLPSHWLWACVSQSLAPPIAPPLAVEVGVKFEELWWAEVKLTALRRLRH